MAQLISVAASYPSTEFDTLIPELTDPADIREAFIAYHFGVSNFDGSTDTPAANSIHSHIETFKDLLTAMRLIHPNNEASPLKFSNEVKALIKVSCKRSSASASFLTILQMAL